MSGNVHVVEAGKNAFQANPLYFGTERKSSIWRYGPFSK
jgi:hypothetical protein